MNPMLVTGVKFEIFIYFVIIIYSACAEQGNNIFISYIIINCRPSSICNCFIFHNQILT